MITDNKQQNSAINKTRYIRNLKAINIHCQLINLFHHPASNCYSLLKGKREVLLTIPTDDQIRWTNLRRFR